MSRHRTDPGGGARVALTVAATAAVIMLAGVGGTALFLALTSASPRSAPSTPSASQVVSSKTLSLKITGPECHVFVRVPGGEVLLDQTMHTGEWARFDEPQLELVLSDGSAAEVYVDGVLQPRGTAGARQEFEISKTA